MENYKQMWKMMENYSFQLEAQQTKLFSCFICDSLLIDSYEGRCGFTYCKKCVDKFINEVGESCPCGNDECWSDSVEFGKFPKKSHFSDKIISEMIVKCPSNACEYKFALIKMDDHLRICDYLISCPFNEVGCDKIKMERNKVSDHLLLELFEHNKMMVEWMRNMKNDVINLMRSIISEITINEIDKSIKTFVDVSVQHSRIVNEEHFNEFRQEIFVAKDKIDRLNLMIKESQELFDKEIHLIKVENEELTRKNQEFYEENKFLTDKINQQNKSLKEMKIANKYLCELRDIKDKEIEQKLDEIKLLNEKIEKPQMKRRNYLSRSRSLLENFLYKPLSLTTQSLSISDALNKPVSIFDVPIETSVISDELIKTVDISNEPIPSFAPFQWIANDISFIQKFSDGQDKWYSNDNQYEIRFQMFNFGCQKDHRNTHICMRFRIVDGSAKIISTRWPLKCIITVSMKSIINEHENIITLAKDAIFQQPNINDLLKLSAQFHFIKSELIAKNIIINDSILMEFKIEINQNK